MNERILVSTLLILSVVVRPAVAATVTGRVVDTSNRPVAEAVVTLSEASAGPTKPSATQAATTTAADGTFSFNNLEAGTYLLCSQVPHGTLLNPCQWTKTMPLVTVASSTAAAAITLTMRSGYRLPIRVDDPQNLLATNAGKTPGAHLLVGVGGGYHFEEAALDATDSAGRNVSVLVPFDVPVAVTVQSNFYKLQDAAGNAMNKSSTLPITISSAAQSGSLGVKVVGTN